VTSADFVLFEYTLPWIGYKLGGVCTASGRIFWPVAYMLMLAAIAILMKYNITKRAMVCFSVCLSIQVLDFGPSPQNRLHAKTPWISPLQSHLWNRFMEKSEHIVFIRANRQYDYYFPFALLAANHRKTINVGDTARKKY
jgi:hypothetical protein